MDKRVMQESKDGPNRYVTVPEFTDRTVIAGILGSNMTGLITVDRRGPGFGVCSFDLTATANQAALTAIAGVVAPTIPVRAIHGVCANVIAGTTLAVYIEPGTGYLKLRSSLSSGQQILGSLALPF